MMSYQTSPRKSYREYSFIRSFIIITLLVVVNIVAIQLNIYFDLTRDRRFSLTRESIELIAQLNEPLSIIYLVPQTALTRQGIADIHQFLQHYAASSPFISYQTLAPNENPLLLSQFSDGGQRIEMGSLLFQYGERRVTIEPFRIINHFTGGTGPLTIASHNTEQIVSNTIFQLLNKTARTLLFTTNHGELALNNLLSSQQIAMPTLLSSHNYQLIFGEILTTDLSEIHTIVMLAPTSDISSEELSMLRSFLSNGGSVYLSLNYQNQIPFHLSQLLLDMGVTLSDRVVRETQNHLRIASDPNQLAFFPQIHSHQITEVLQQGQLRPIMMLPIYMQIPSLQPAHLNHQILLSSSPQAEILVPAGNNQWAMQPLPNQIAAPLALAITQQLGDSLARFYLITGDLPFLSNNYANESLMLQALAWLNNTTPPLAIVPTNLYESPMRNITARSAISLAVLFTAIIPLLLIVSAITIYFIRKRA